MYSYVSSQHERVYQISGKLTSILNTLESDKDYYVDQIEKRISAIESSIFESLEQDSKKFKILSDKVSILSKKVEDLENVRESFFSSKIEEMAEFSELISEELGQSEYKKKETELKLQRIIDDRMNSINSDLSRDIKSRKEGFDSLNDYCRSNLTKIKELLKKELIERDENSEKFNSGILGRIQVTKQLIFVEKEAREKAEEALLAMLQEHIQ